MKAKKSLGQNWLTSESAREAIIRAANLTEAKPPYTVVEVGPGQGFLTEALLQTSAKVITVEKDDRLIEQLQEMFAPEIESGQLKLVHADILETDIEKLVTGDYKLVANIPYYITGELIQRFLTAGHQPKQMVLMLQREVAERIVARDGKESILSISVKVYGAPKYIKTVPAGAFKPVPKVDSAILQISNISRENFQKVSEKNFFEFVKRGFAHKRKLLRGNLGVSGEVLTTCGITDNARAENVTIEQWLQLSQKLS